MTLRRPPDLERLSDLAPRWVRALLRRPTCGASVVIPDDCRCEWVARVDGVTYRNWYPGCPAHDPENDTS